tara:strand:- start:19695 stop:21659 length:1965 start_codon:yes stop_codon:yes gene_type:complete
MCGISGIITNNSTKEEIYKNINLMTSKIKHRGPDDYGVWIDTERGISMAHNRLSIIDLSKSGHQPMKSKNGRYIISFNGEIYNYKEIKVLLDKEFGISSRWNGASDTEVLITAIEFWGLRKTLDIIKGMFAFSLWDNDNRDIYLVRDRFGEKPLYWGFVRNNYNNYRDFVFSSELSAITALPFFNNKFSNKGLNDYFNYGYISAPNSIYDEIYQLIPGNLLKINQEEFFDNNLYNPKPEIWYKLTDKKKERNKSYNKNELKDILEDIITKSISLQNNADVPICTFLSGGIDSTLVATLLQKICIEKINTLTISFPGDKKSKSPFNEGPYAAKIANYLGTHHIDIPITPKDALGIIPNLCNIYSEPFSDSSQIATYLLCKATKYSGYKVALTGDGADELFGGYNRHIFTPRIYELLSKSPKELKKIIYLIIKNLPLSSKGLVKDKRQKIIKTINESNSIESIYEGLLNLGINNNQNLLINNIRGTNENIINVPFAKTNSERIMLKDLLFYLPSDILVKTDRASMHNSIETRAPLLDHEIAEFAVNLPLKMKSYSNKISRTGKIILKDILKKYIPEDMFLRPKAGFAVPIGSWLKGPLRDWACDLLSENKIKEQEFLNYKLIEEIWSKHNKNEYDYTPQLWCILMWQSWIENKKSY